MEPDDFRKQALGHPVEASEAEPSEHVAEEAEAVAPDYYLVEDEAEFDFTGLSGPNA